MCATTSEVPSAGHPSRVSATPGHSHLSLRRLARVISPASGQGSPRQVGNGQDFQFQAKLGPQLSRRPVVFSPGKTVYGSGLTCELAQGLEPSVLFLTPAAMGVTTGADTPIISTRVSVKLLPPPPPLIQRLPEPSGAMLFGKKVTGTATK